MISRWSAVASFVMMTVLAPQLAAQQVPPATNQEMFAPLDLARPTTVRAGTGEPGEGYWQQGADYVIRAEIDPSQHQITGSESIRYTNNSPDQLDELWLQLDQNLFAPGSRGSTINPDNRWRGAFDGGGFQLSRVELVHKDGTREQADYFVNDTRMKISLTKPMSPRGDELTIEFDWSFVVPEYGADRMGRLEVANGWIYEIAQWYPRMYVYDDVEGWNPMPYLGQGEFYLEYGSFDVEITAPRELVLVATGALQNEVDVLTTAQRRRLASARASTETVTIISADEVGTEESRPSGTGPLTWNFHAENVRDFSWAASRAFVWDAADANGVLVMSVYPVEGIGSGDNTRPGWEMATQYARHTIDHYSSMWYQYPYPVAVNVAGIVGGMEYPGIVFCGVNARGQGLFGVTDHEFGHSWFPMIVGSDERRYAWMDEGFNTFINRYSNIEYYGAESQRAVRTGSGFIAGRMQEPIADQPIMTYPDMLRRDGLGFMGYRKPGFGLILLREVVLGQERFDHAFRSYVSQWAFKHPQPADFFRAIEDDTGEDLSWFWRGWIYSTDLLDQAVDSVTVAENGSSVFISNGEGLVMPAEVEVQFDDGEIMRRSLPVEIWYRSDYFTLPIPDPRQISTVTIDPDYWMPDVDRNNNKWARPTT